MAWHSQQQHSRYVLIDSLGMFLIIGGTEVVIANESRTMAPNNRTGVVSEYDGITCAVEREGSVVSKQLANARIPGFELQ